MMVMLCFHTIYLHYAFILSVRVGHNIFSYRHWIDVIVFKLYHNVDLSEEKPWDNKTAYRGAYRVWETLEFLFNE